MHGLAQERAAEALAPGIVITAIVMQERTFHAFPQSQANGFDTCLAGWIRFPDSNGCICCTLREDVLEEVSRLAREGRFDYLLIESTGIAEPLPVAETFTFRDEQGRSLSDVVRLDTMVTVVDGINFLRDFHESESLASRGETLGEEDERSITDLLIEQVEFADVILISKIDLISSAEREELTAILRGLNTHAEIIPMSMGQVPLGRILDTGRFDFERAAQAPGWLKELRGEHVRKARSTVSPRPRTVRAGRSIRSVSMNFLPVTGATANCCAPRASSGLRASTARPVAGPRPAA